MYYHLKIAIFQDIFPNVETREQKLHEKTEKDNYHIPNSYRPISLSNIMGKIYEKFILQEAVSLFTERKFLDEKNVYAYQKNEKDLKP